MLRKVLLTLGMNALGGFVREVAEGKRGPALQRLYLALKGYKTLTGVLLGGGAVALAAIGFAEQAGWVGLVGALLVSVGLADKAWRSAPESWAAQKWYAFLRNNMADVIALGGVATAALTRCEGTTAAVMARVNVSCGTGILVVSGLLAFLSWLVGEAKLAREPRPTRE